MSFVFWLKAFQLVLIWMEVKILLIHAHKKMLLQQSRHEDEINAWIIISSSAFDTKVQHSEIFLSWLIHKNGTQEQQNFRSLISYSILWSNRVSLLSVTFCSSLWRRMPINCHWHNKNKTTKKINYSDLILCTQKILIINIIIHRLL